VSFIEYALKPELLISVILSGAILNYRADKGKGGANSWLSFQAHPLCLLFAVSEAL